MSISTRKNFIRGFLWTSILQFSSVGTQFLSTIILARFLSPHDYGTMGAIIIFIAIGDMVVDSGMGGSLIKKKDTLEIDYSTLFIYNIGISVLMYFLLYIGASYISDFYQEYKDLDIIIRYLAIVVIIHAFSIVQRIKMLKELKFKELAIITTISSFLGLLSAIIIAIYGGGVWALVFQPIVTSIAMSILYITYNRYIPSFRFSIISLKEQFSWGINLLLANTVRTINENIYSSVIAKVSSSILTGYYTQAVRIKNLPVGIMTQVVDKAIFPILAQENNTVTLKQNIRKLNRLVLLVVCSTLLCIISMSDSIVYILLGKQWLGTTWILEILLYSSIFLCIQSLYRNILKSMGLTRIILNNEFVKISISLSILFISILGNFETIIYGILFSNFLGSIWIMFKVKKELSYTFAEQIKDILPIIGISFLSFGPVYILFSYIKLPIAINILLESLLFGTLLITLLYYMRFPEWYYVKMAFYKFTNKYK